MVEGKQKKKAVGSWKKVKGQLTFGDTSGWRARNEWVRIDEKNYYFGMDSGAETEDRIFLPAESELFIHDSSEIHGFSRRDDVADRARQFKPTDYAILKGVWKESGERGNVFWITRTTGYTHDNVVYVDESGYMYNRGSLVTCSDAAVIPALVLDLDSSVYEYAGVYTIGAGAR